MQLSCIERKKKKKCLLLHWAASTALHTLCSLDSALWANIKWAWYVLWGCVPHSEQGKGYLQVTELLWSSGDLQENSSHNSNFVWSSAIWCRSTKVFCASVRIVTSQGNCEGNWAIKGSDARGDIAGCVRIQLHRIPFVFLWKIIAKVVFWMILYSLALIPCF